MFVFVKIIILMSKCIAKSEIIAWQSRGHGFEPRYLHQEKTDSPKGLSVFSFGKPKCLNRSFPIQVIISVITGDFPKKQLHRSLIAANGGVVRLI